MIKKLLLLCLGLFVLTSLCSADPDTTKKPIRTTVCKVVRNPDDYDGALVSLTGSLEVRGFESESYIWSKQCRGSMEIGDGEDAVTSNTESLERALGIAQRLSDRRQNYVVLADIEGLFRVERSNSSRVRYIFYIRSASNIKIIKSASIVPPFPRQ